MTPRSLPDDVLDRWLADTPTAHDRDLVRAWIAEAPGREAELVALTAAAQDSYRWKPIGSSSLDALKASVRQAPAEDSYARSTRRSRTRSAAHSDARNGKPMPLATRSRWVWRGVGVLGLAAAALVVIRESRPVVSTSTLERTIITATGERRVVRLADGSRVTLAPRTTVTVDPAYGVTARTVSLVGEAYFDVVPGARAPFVVRAGTVSTRVLGTTFDVKHYLADSVTRVTVVSGKVQAERAGHSPVLLAAGMIGTMTDSGATVLSSENVTSYAGWTQGHLEFDVTPVPEVLATMERWYGVRFRVADSVVNHGTVSGRLDFATAEGAMKALKVLLGVTMTFEHVGDTTIVVLHASRSRTSAVPSRRAIPVALTTSHKVGR